MSNEWYTPSKYIEAAREVMGSIDLDPASCALANQTVRAARYYTQEDDGLSQAWYGNVWLNPPYGKADPTRSGLAKWNGRAIAEYQMGNVEQVILLVIAQTDSSWFQSLWTYPLCFADHHLRFRLGEPRRDKWHLGAITQGHMWGTVFVYLGLNEQRFIDVFSQFGRIAKAVDVPVAKPRQLELVS